MKFVLDQLRLLPVSERLRIIEQVWSDIHESEKFGGIIATQSHTTSQPPFPDIRPDRKPNHE
jgi:hypothetical protein